MGEDKGDQLTLTRVLAEEKEKRGREASVARRKAEERSQVLDKAGDMTTSTSLPQALREAQEAEILARELEQKYRVVAQDVETLTPSGSTKRLRHRKSGQPRPAGVPLNLLRPFPGIESPTVHVGKRSR